MTTTALAADNASRAAAAYSAMQSTFHHRPSKLYRERSPYDPTPDQPNSYLWSFEEAVKAIQCIHAMPGAAGRYAIDLQDRLTAREQYWDGNNRQRAYRSYRSTGDPADRTPAHARQPGSCWVVKRPVRAFSRPAATQELFRLQQLVEGVRSVKSKDGP